jgi:hypothetical protein
MATSMNVSLLCTFRSKEYSRKLSELEAIEAGQIFRSDP